MRHNILYFLGGPIAVVAIAFLVGAPALSQAPLPQPQLTQPSQPPLRLPPAPPQTLTGKIAAATELSEQDVELVLRALGPAVKELLARNGQADLPGVGLLRIIRVAEHRDLQNGRPIVIPAYNYLEFQANGDLDGVANTGGIRPVDTVPAFQYSPLPNQTKSLRTPKVRTPDVRTR